MPRTRFGRSWRRPTTCRSSTCGCCWGMRTWRSPAGRDRALDEVVPVLSAMPESITREELEREVGVEAGGGPWAGAPAGCRAPPGARAERRSGRRSVEGDPGPEDDGGGAPRCSAAGPLSARERRERSLLRDGDRAALRRRRRSLERLTPAHLSSGEMIRARDWLVAHLEAPLDGIPHDDEAFVALVTQLVMDSEREPGSRARWSSTSCGSRGRWWTSEIDGRDRERGRPPGRAPEAPRRALRADRQLRPGALAIRTYVRFSVRS